MFFLPEKEIEKVVFPAVFDNTMLEAWDKCQTEYMYEFALHKQTVATSVDLHAGASFATGLEIFRRAYFTDNLGFSKAYELGALALWDAYGSFIPEVETPKTRLAMMTAYDYFLTEAFPPGTDHSQPFIAGGEPAIEFSFALPIPEVTHPLTGEPLLYCGRLDQIVTHASALMVEDDKTTKALGARWRSSWVMRSQFTGYVWGVQQFGYPVVGALIRGVSILKYDHGHEEAIVFRKAHEIKQWYAETVARLNEIKAAYVTGTYHQSLGSSCTLYSGCPFVQLCQAIDPFQWMGNYATRVWNPLHRDQVNNIVQGVEPKRLKR